MNNISIVIGGGAGQGIKTIEQHLSKIAKFSDLHVYSTQEYESRIRGGINSTEIRVSDNRVDAYVDRIDLLLFLKPGVINHLKKRISKNTLILGETENLNGKERDLLTNFYHLPFNELAKAAGNQLYANSVIVGVISKLISLDDNLVKEITYQYFAKKSTAIAESNLIALKKGLEAAEKLNVKTDFRFLSMEKTSKHLFVNGTESIAMGALNGGCNFMSFYPMSPGTGVASFFAQHDRKLEVAVEQMEDEIAAVNAALGAWYAGARAMITTSGGGFALMAEGLSLAGIMESPMVFHIGMRPGPGTGLPTRTGQEDLLFSAFGGHGEFSRILLAPGSLQDGYFLSMKAFELADKYQVPVFILSDQYFLDTYYNIENLPFSRQKPKHYISKSGPEYIRYAFTENGLSQRAVPGYGDGLVCTDSDEHDESGHITEDFEIRNKMVEKRLSRQKLILEDYIKPELIGSEDYEYLVIGWGSTRNVVAEAIENMKNKKIAFLHLKQLLPLPTSLLDYFNRAKITISLENNATGQLAKILAMELGFPVQKKILKYDGLPFSVEEVKIRLNQIIEGK
ncbi:MAG: 2-oxoacid:acceptor oxidoreductase subunit alpha [Candidatus Marinimicrobia bacterium]|nr:2-oxoacid:acceptor oxidoreductase subunit alpha [Candidatus Neomarinimicrobiota bacterium]